MKSLVAVVAIVALGAAAFTSVFAAYDDKPKYTIKEVMKLHKEKLHEKVIKGGASKEEKEKLREAYEEMGKNDPPKGDKDEWKKRSETLAKAVKEDDTKALETAVKCGDCHKAHKAD
jgi:uncharacterized protein with ATP-grasp and redox domains